MSSSSLPPSASVVGFGSRTPDVVLDLLVAVRNHDHGKNPQIHLQRSPALELALLERGVFVSSNGTHDNSSTTTQATCGLLVYCLCTTSWAESMTAANVQEAARVRSAILTAPQTVVVAYDPATSKLLLGNNDKVSQQDVVQAVAALNNHNATAAEVVRSALASATLRALAKLDSAVAERAFQGNGDTVIVVGGGGREHALAVQLAQSPAVARVVCVPGNGGTTQPSGTGSTSSKICNMGANQDNATVLELTKSQGAQMVVVGPEGPLVNGLVDELAVACPDVLAFGPTQAAAQLEASKAFSKDFFAEHGIPTAEYRNFTSVQDAVAYVTSLDIDNASNRNRVVVKASGLAAGKGVLLPETHAETIQAVHDIMSDGKFGTAGDTCVIEAYLTGPEASCLALCDGATAVLLPAAQDHKRALDGDLGLNTGGMGAYAPAPCVTPARQAEILAMCQTTVAAMRERGTPYTGVLYAGVILTADGPKLLEYNCRFGDPETQVVLPLLETDLYQVLQACCRGTLDTCDVRCKPGQHAATVVCAAQGYPQAYPKGMIVSGLDDDDDAVVPGSATIVYHAGTKRLDSDGSVRCTGGRVLSVTGVGGTLQSALKTAYTRVQQLDFVAADDNNNNNNSCESTTTTTTSLMHFRTDIGKQALSKKLRIGVLGSTRGTALLPVIDACNAGELASSAEICAVLSDKASAEILNKGRALGPAVLTKHVSAKGLSREQYDAQCTAALLSAGVDYILLVGYMRILSKPFVDYWKGRCINVHPSLLPKHAGGMDLAVHQAVLDAHDTETGCTIHEVTEAVDGGPIVVQTKVKVEYPGETKESLKAKVQPLEGPAFINAIQLQCQKKGSISYADAGVSIDAGNRLVDLIKPLCKATRVPGCDADLGGFGGLFDLAAAGHNAAETVLIGATDGVGTKLRVAQVTQKHETVGIDLVAMCVNDLVVAGGEPLFFLDYFATGHLEIEQAAAVVKGIAEGCKQSNCGLIGGETAEMPSMYSPGDYDLAGFTVGAVHKDNILPQNVCAGDVLLGVSSSGIHSNGFSLVRKLIEKEGLSYDSPCPWDTSQPTVGDALLIPTKIYVKSCLPPIKRGLLKALAHITGGGLLENLPRSLPKGVAAEITHHPALPPVFKWMQQASGLADDELLKTFNCGIGMVLILSRDNVSEVLELLADAGETDVCEIGVLVEGAQEVHMKVGLA